MNRILIVFLSFLMIVLLPACQRESSPGPESTAQSESETAAEPPVAAKPLLSGIQLDALDPETRPQDDFYQFANGGWLDRTEIPEIYSGYTVYHQVYEDAEQALKAIIEEAASNPGEPGSESQQVGDAYNSFMDVDTINARGVAVIQPELDLVAGIANQQDLSRVMAALTRQRIDSPTRLAINPDLKDSSRYVAYLGQSGITMPDRDYYLQTDNENFRAAREALPLYIAAMLQRAGDDPARAQAKAQAVYDIEAAIAEAQWDNVALRDPEKGYNPYPVDQLDQLGTNRDWSVTLPELGLEQVDQLIIEQPSYFEALDDLL
ncbi:MAG TPA: M13 family metallopeptidase N-terminal domain-containing protein, partial [Xanthomonadales bacterium]|nr:M13 family metallopeptidase N-terminal domain-containing protein [Xanthomonadales bacterium]